MKRTFVAVVLAVFVLLIAPGPRADAQVPTQVPGPTTETDVSSDDGDGRPWGRLAIFIPVSVALGAAAISGRRIARDRGWFGS